MAVWRDRKGDKWQLEGICGSGRHTDTVAQFQTISEPGNCYLSEGSCCVYCSDNLGEAYQCARNLVRDAEIVNGAVPAGGGRGSGRASRGAATLPTGHPATSRAMVRAPCRAPRPAFVTLALTMPGGKAAPQAHDEINIAPAQAECWLLLPICRTAFARRPLPSVSRFRQAPLCWLPSVDKARIDRRSVAASPSSCRQSTAQQEHST